MQIPDRHHYKLARRKFLKLISVAATGLLLPSWVTVRKRQKIRFGLVTDSHYADTEPRGTRIYRESLEKMKECIGVMNKEKVDFLVHLGDFKDQDENQNGVDTLRYLGDLEAEYAKFEGPRYHCLGNHDMDSITKQQFLMNIENTGIGKDKKYYSFDSNGFHFVVLDANFHHDGRDHYYKEGADWQDTNIPEEEVEWLKNDLDSTSLRTVVLCHHPLHEFQTHGAKYHVNNFESIQQVLESQKKVVAVFHGHVHQEHYRKINGIHYCTQLAMVDHSGLENNSFSIVTIDKDKIQVDGYKRVSDQLYRHV